MRISLSKSLLAQIKQVAEDREFLRTRRKFDSAGREYHLTDGFLLAECIKDREAAIGKLIAERVNGKL